MGNGLLILVLGSMMTMLFVSTTFVKTKQGGFDNSMSYYEDNYTRNMANSMINMLLTRLAEDFEYREEGDEKDILNGTVEYKVLDTVMIRRNATWTGPPGQKDKGKEKFQHFWSYDTTGTDTVIKIEVVARYNKYENKSTAYTLAGRAGGWVPPVVRGAWTANGPLNNTISDMYIDGRNHDLNLNIVPNTGTRAISTSVEFINIENAAIGGTSTDSTDYILSYPENDAVIEENYNWGGTFPETPDEILGYPEGTLKKLGQSGEMGSQYVLNPSNSIEDDLNFPLSGVTYIEITDGKERELKMDGTGGKQNGGILVIHGPGTQAKITGLKMETDDDKTKIKEGGVLICHNPGMPDQITMTAEPAGEMDTEIVPTTSGDIEIEPQSTVQKGSTVTFELSHKKIKNCSDYNGQVVRVYIDGVITNINLSDCEFDVNIPGLSLIHI